MIPLKRIVALLVIGTLCLDPALIQGAVGFTSPLTLASPRRPNQSGQPFETQTLTLAVGWMLAPLLKPAALWSLHQVSDAVRGLSANLALFVTIGPMIAAAFGKARTSDWDWLLADPRTESTRRERLSRLRDLLTRDSIRRKLVELREQGVLELTDEQLEGMDVVLFGDYLRMPRDLTAFDVDVFILVPGSAHYIGEWKRAGLPIIDMAVEGLEMPPGSSPRYARGRVFAQWVLATGGVLLNGTGEVLAQFAHDLNPDERLAFAEDLVFKASAAESMERPEKVWSRALEAYIVLRPVLSAAVASQFEKKVFRGPLQDWFHDVFSGRRDLPWRDEEFLMRFQDHLSHLIPALRRDVAPNAPSPGAVGGFWSWLLPRVGPAATMAIAAGVEGSVIGGVAYAYHGQGHVAFIMALLFFIAHVVFGILQGNESGRWELKRSWKDKDFRWPALFSSVAVGLTSLAGFLPAALGADLWLDMLVAIVPHLILNSAISVGAWKRLDVRRLERALRVKKLRDLSENELTALQKTLDIFKPVDDDDQSIEVQYLVHRFKLNYIPDIKEWEIELRPSGSTALRYSFRSIAWRWVYGPIGRLMARRGWPGPQSGRVVFRFAYDPAVSSFHILTGTQVFDGFDDQGLYGKALSRIRERLPDPTVVWHSLDEIQSLIGLYNALPEKWQVPGASSAHRLVEKWKAGGKSPAEVIERLRRIIWKAYYRHQMRSAEPLVSREELGKLKLARALKGGRLDVIAEPGEVLLLRSIEGKTALSDGMPWRERPEWLVRFWLSLEANSQLKMPTPEEEEYMRGWEMQFTRRFEERIGRPAPDELLREIRFYTNSGAMDLMIAAHFAADLPASQHALLDDDSVLARFHTFLGNHNYMEALQQGWDLFLFDLPDLQQVVETQTWLGKPFPLSSPQAYWAADLVRDYKIPLEVLFNALGAYREQQVQNGREAERSRQYLSKKVQKTNEEIQRNEAQLAPVLEILKRHRDKEGDSFYRGRDSTRIASDYKVEQDGLHGIQTTYDRRWTETYEAAIRSVARSARPEASQAWGLMPRLMGYFIDEPLSRIHNVLSLLSG